LRSAATMRCPEVCPSNSSSSRSRRNSLLKPWITTKKIWSIKYPKSNLCILFFPVCNRRKRKGLDKIHPHSFMAALYQLCVSRLAIASCVIVMVVPPTHPPAPSPNPQTKPEPHLHPLHLQPGFITFAFVCQSPSLLINQLTIKFSETLHANQ